MQPEDSVSSHGGQGRLLQLGFYWTTTYIQKHDQFYSLRGNRQPDGHMLFEAGKLLITVEATADPGKPNLESQLLFYSSAEYHDTVVDQPFHEIWLFVAEPASKSILTETQRIVNECHRDLTVPVIVWSVDYDKPRGKYIMQKVWGEHSVAIPPKGSIPPPRIEVGEPRAYPLLSSHLSFPAVCFALGTELLQEIVNPRPIRTLREYHLSLRTSAVPFSYFSKAIGYLGRIVPELVHVTKGKHSERTLRVKKNYQQISIIRRKLDEIRACESEEGIIELAKKYETLPPEQPPKEKKRMRETEKGPLDRFMNE